MKLKNQRVKGFTLIELIIVIAIIGVLVGILAPTMATYYWKSRVKSANAEAKMIYNAVQTEAQKYIAHDRTHTGANEKSQLDGYYMISYSPVSGTAVYSVDSSTRLTNSGAITPSGTNQGLIDAANRIVRNANRTVSDADTKCWSVYINNYIVKACIAADNTDTPYVGQYSAGRITVPDSRPNNLYSSWLPGGSSHSLMADLADRYDNTP